MVIENSFYFNSILKDEEVSLTFELRLWDNQIGCVLISYLGKGQIIIAFF